MKETGRVKGIQDGIVIIEVAGHRACHKCGLCGAGQSGTIAVTAEKAKGLRIDDQVEISINAAKIMRAYLILYALPMIFFVFTAVLVYVITRSPLAGFSAAIAVTAATYGITGRCIRSSGFFSPEILLKH